MFGEIERRIIAHKATTGEGEDIIAAKLGISTREFQQKLKGSREFTISEIHELMIVLGATSISELIDLSMYSLGNDLFDSSGDNN
jgi:hypothetical protein